jgi:hypothetical protein
VLTGRDTVPAAFVAAAHRGGRIERARHVRHLALGLGQPGTVACPTTDDGILAVLAAGGVLDLDVPAAALDDDAITSRGRAIDEREPDAFERSWSAVQPGDAAATGDGGACWTHGGLLWAARSFAQGVHASEGVRIHVSPASEADGIDGVRAVVVRTLVPAITGATLVDLGAEIAVRPAGEIADAARPFVEGLRGGRRGRIDAAAARDALDLARCRLALLTGEAAVAVDWLRMLGVPAEPLLAVPGCASPVRANTPMPGVTIGVADDGEVLVRAGAVAPARCRDGWLHTGRYE